MQTITTKESISTKIQIPTTSPVWSAKVIGLASDGIDTPMTMSSREIAELTGKEHFHVLRDIRAMLSELKEDESKFGGIFLDTMNRKQTEYHLDRELTDTLLTGYSAVMRRKVIARWHHS